MTTKPATELTVEYIGSLREVASTQEGEVPFTSETIIALCDLALQALAHREPAGDVGEMCERLKRGVVTIGRWPPQGPDIEATEAVMEEAATLIERLSREIKEQAK